MIDGNRLASGIVILLFGVYLCNFSLVICEENMIYTIVITLYLLAGSAICAMLIACFTHTEKMEEIVEGELTNCRKMKDTVRMVPPHKMLIVSAVLSMFSVVVGAAVVIAWPVLLLVLRGVK